MYDKNHFLRNEEKYRIHNMINKQKIQRLKINQKVLKY